MTYWTYCPGREECRFGESLSTGANNIVLRYYVQRLLGKRLPLSGVSLAINDVKSKGHMFSFSSHVSIAWEALACVPLLECFSGLEVIPIVGSCPVVSA